MQSGLLFGYVSMVEGMVARFGSELGSDMKVIATGGLAEVIAKETKVNDIIAPWLTLDGLRLIWELNRQSEKIDGLDYRGDYITVCMWNIHCRSDIHGNLHTPRFASALNCHANKYLDRHPNHYRFAYSNCHLGSTGTPAGDRPNHFISSH